MMQIEDWIRFLRKYGPIPRNDNMYDETIQRTARRYKIKPIEFKHPHQKKVIDSIISPDPVSIILTGTAGDGKTHLCRKVWGALKKDDLKGWASDDPYLNLKVLYPKDRETWPPPKERELRRVVTIHFIRDLSAWAPQDGYEWAPEKEKLLFRFCKALFDSSSDDVFLVAGNDGQLIETFERFKKRFEDIDLIQKALNAFEDLLVDDKQEKEGIRLRFFNLSRGNSSELFQLAVESFLNHDGWRGCLETNAGENEAFGPNCPIRRNFELLQTPLIHSRMTSLFELCDYNGLHVPLRQILLMLTNAILGHPDVKDRLMVPGDVPGIISAGTVSKASIYNNLFGGNLTEMRRNSITVFDYFDQFQIGYETTNRIDNILIFGEENELFSTPFKEFMTEDTFYGADEKFHAARRGYIEGTEENETATKDFMDLLISQRRGLFFKIPKASEAEFGLWKLTVFKYAGEYLDSFVDVLKSSGSVSRQIISRLVRGINRIFTGTLINNDREIFLATSGNYSQARICRILIDKISVYPSKGEKVQLKHDVLLKRVILSVYLTPDIFEDFDLNLIRYEFLSRVADEGVLPACFSRECYEDILAFKTRLLAAQKRRREAMREPPTPISELNILSLSDQGVAEENFVEVML